MQFGENVCNWNVFLCKTIGICEYNWSWRLTSDLLFWKASQKQQHMQHLNDKVSSFLNQFLQVVAVQGHQSRPACKTTHTLSH